MGADGERRFTPVCGSPSSSPPLSSLVVSQRTVYCLVESMSLPRKFSEAEEGRILNYEVVNDCYHAF